MTGERFRLVGSEENDREWTFQVEVPRDSPYFAGHFPGRPVLPAIAQLAILTEVYCGKLAPERVIGAVPQLRFQRNIEPEQRLTYHVGHPDEGARSSFAIRHDGRTVSRGAIVWSQAG